MLKAIFFDLDETLCDTTGANKKALAFMAKKARLLFAEKINEHAFANAYLKGIYRDLDERYAQKLLPITNEEQFRLALIQLILSDLGITNASINEITELQQSFDEARAECFDFFTGIKELLIDLRAHFTIIIITNGPEFSQLAKINAVNLHEFVDHIIIGGQEKEQKPALSIFQKALTLSQCKKDEVIHIGDSLTADIAGANNAGITSVWVSHTNDLPDDSSIIPTHIIENPFQIRDLIHSIHSFK
jgi:HAD superfamily hydrolase (TIGR01549 family)